MSATEIKQTDMTSNGLFGIITVKQGVTRWSLKAVRETSRDVWLETEEEEQLNENCKKNGNEQKKALDWQRSCEATVSVPLHCLL